MKNMKEQYLVKFNYKKPYGFWIIGKEKYINLDYNKKNEKSNHKRAEQRIYEIYHDCKVSIVSVTYC